MIVEKQQSEVISLLLSEIGGSIVEVQSSEDPTQYEYFKMTDWSPASQLSAENGYHFLMGKNMGHLIKDIKSTSGFDRKGMMIVEQKIDELVNEKRNFHHSILWTEYLA